jgi:hypothetical protein
VVIEVGRQFLDRVGVATLGDEQDPAFERISGQGDVVVASGTRCLIDGQCSDLAEVSQAQGNVHIALAHGQHAVSRFAHDAGHRREWHLLRQHQDQRLEQQREARQAPRKVGLDQAYRAIGQLHARRAHLQVTFMLEEVQVPIGLGHRVVHRMLAFMPGDREARTRLEVHQHYQQLGRLVKLHQAHRPRRCDTQRRFKQLGRHLNSSFRCPI